MYLINDLIIIRFIRLFVRTVNRKKVFINYNKLHVVVCMFHVYSVHLCLPLCLSVCLSVYLYVCLCVCVFVCMSGCLSLCLSVVCLGVYLCVCIFVCLGVLQAKRRYYEKSQQSDTLEMTLKDAHTLKSTYAPRKWDNVC